MESNFASSSGKITFLVFDSFTPAPTLTANVVSNGTVAEVSWPLVYTGWALQFETNSLTAGLGTNWQDVAGSTATNRVWLPLPPANSCALYWLKLL